MFVSSRLGRKFMAVAAMAVALPVTFNQLNAQDNHKPVAPVNEVDLWPGFSMGTAIPVKGASRCRTMALKGDSQATYTLRCQATETRAGEAKRKSRFRDRQFHETRDSR
jgi:hypothetical protein